MLGDLSAELYLAFGNGYMALSCIVPINNNNNNNNNNNMMMTIIIKLKLKIKSVACSSQGSHTGN